MVTADLALAACGRSWVPVRRSWRLNSNHYGALQGRGKAEVRAEAGDEQFTAWRRGFRVRPPLGEPDDDPRYAALPPDARPRGESLHDVAVRLLPYWCDAIVPDLYRYNCVLVVSHGNTLRALVKHLEDVGDDASSGLEVPNAVPVVTNLSRACHPAVIAITACRGRDRKSRLTGEIVLPLNIDLGCLGMNRAKLDTGRRITEFRGPQKDQWLCARR